MLEEISKKIDDSRSMLSTLPKNNKKNVSRYDSKLREFLDEYQVLLQEVKEEICKRTSTLLNIKENKEIDLLEKEINNISNNLYLLSKSNSSYEKVGLELILYNISKYYKTNLYKVNENIREAIFIFNRVGIELTASDFNYSFYAMEYMRELFLSLSDLERVELKDSFEKIYWKCSDLLVHIELNFKYLYYKNKKKFDTYCEKLILEFLSGRTREDVFLEYKKLKKQYDSLKREDSYRIIKSFEQKEFMTSDFSDSKIISMGNEIIDDNFGNDISNDLLKFYYSLSEYQDYLEVSYFIDDIKKDYLDKSSYKSETKVKFREIKKLERKLFSLNRKIDWFRKRKKDYDKLVIATEGIISNLKELYDNQEMNLFKDRIHLLVNEDTTYYEVLEFIVSNYEYLVWCVKNKNKEATDLEIKEELEKIRKILLCPYLTIINHMSIGSSKDIKIVISDCYKLSNFKVSTDTLEGDIDGIKGIIKKLVIYQNMKKNNILVDDVKLLIESISEGIIDNQ